MDPIKDPDRWGVSVDTAEYLSNLCKDVKPKMILEIGTFPGRSIETFIRSRPAGAKIITVEHDDKRQGAVIKNLKERGISLDGIDFLLAPLREIVRNGAKALWYDTEPLKRIPQGIDLLFVDGLHRGPELDEFYWRLSGRAIILVDDIRRDHTKAAFSSWTKSLTEAGRPFKASEIKAERGLGEIRLL